VFYRKVLADPVLRRLFPERQPHHVEHLTWFTAESFGGPDRFTRDLSFDHLIEVHRHLEITEEERQRFTVLYKEALDEAGLPDDEPFREAVRSYIEFGSRVAQQNSHAKTDADLHPLRQVPGSTLDVAARHPRLARCRHLAALRHAPSMALIPLS
jgi:hemoglobin